MKIKEFINEGLWDRLKGYAKTGSAGYQAAAAREQGQKQLDDYLKIMFRKWNEYQAQTGDTDIVKWAGRFFKTDKINYMPGADDPASQRNFLRKTIQDYKAGRLSTAAKSPDPAGAEPISSEEDQIRWDPDKNMLSIDGTKYQRSKKGWIDWNTKELISAPNDRELNTAFDKVTGRVPVQ